MNETRKVKRGLAAKESSSGAIASSRSSSRLLKRKFISCSNLLVSLPVEIFAKTFSQYLTLGDLALFDCAMTNHLLRTHFNELYPFIVLQTPTTIMDEGPVRWMRNRSVKLAHLEVWNGLGKRSLTYLLKTGNYLHSLNLTGYDFMSDHLLSVLSTGCPSLRCLNLAYCSDITDEGVSLLASSCHELTHLTLWGCYQLSNDSLRDLAAGCPKLVHLNFRCCKKITDEGLEILSGFRKLVYLNFTYCKNISDAGIHRLASTNPGLRYLILAYCELLTDYSVQAVVSHCNHIQNLDVTGCAITDASLVLVARSQCRSSLVELWLNTCREVTDLGMQALSLTCRWLRSLHIEGCEQITDAGLRGLPPACQVHM